MALFTVEMEQESRFGEYISECISVDIVAEDEDSAMEIANYEYPDFLAVSATENDAELERTGGGENE